MKIVIAYSHVDSRNALRLLCWLKFLGGVPVPLLVVSTRRAACTKDHVDIDQLLRSEFPNSEHWVASDEDERGWPRSSTHLFSRSIVHAADDVFWLEPDAVPTRENWFQPLLDEFNATDATFVGCFVPTGKNHPDHMTGVAFYGKNWTKSVPDLCVINEKGTGAWDVDRAESILKDFTATKKIQHRWIRESKDQRVDPGTIRPEVLVYHQCKSGALMTALRPEFADAPLTLRYFPVTPKNTMPKYYQTQNAAKAVELDGRRFEFDPVEYFSPTMSWWGVYEAVVDEDIQVLDAAVRRHLIEEISEDDFNLLLSKKNKPTSSPSLTISKNLHAPQMGQSGNHTNVVRVAAGKPAPAFESVEDALTARPAVRASR